MVHAKSRNGGNLRAAEWRLHVDASQTRLSFLLRCLFDTRGDGPDVPRWIHDPCGAVAPELVGQGHENLGPCGNRAIHGFVDVLDIRNGSGLNLVKIGSSTPAAVTEVHWQPWSGMRGHSTAADQDCHCRSSWTSSGHTKDTSRRTRRSDCSRPAQWSWSLRLSEGQDGTGVGSSWHLLKSPGEHSSEQ
jgi:hypothetical protein